MIHPADCRNPVCPEPHTIDSQSATLTPCVAVLEGVANRLRARRDDALSPLVRVAYADVLSALEGELEGIQREATHRNGIGADPVPDGGRLGGGLQHVPADAQVSDSGAGIAPGPHPDQIAGAW